MRRLHQQEPGLDSPFGRRLNDGSFLVAAAQHASIWGVNTHGLARLILPAWRARSILYSIWKGMQNGSARTC